MPGKTEHSSHVQSVARALQLVELLAKNRREMSLTEISKTLNWPKSTVHGLLSTLRDYRYIDQAIDTGHYRLGVRLFELGSAVAHSWDVRELSLPIMQKLNRELGEMVQLGTESDGEVLYIEKIDSSQLLRIVSETGARLPMHCTGLGKMLLAHKSPAEIRWIVQKHGLPRMTRRTITTLPALERELDKIRRQGYALDDREIMDGLRCIAAPVRDQAGAVRYAVSVSGPVSVLQGTHLDKALAALLEGAEAISRGMGYRTIKDVID